MLKETIVMIMEQGIKEENVIENKIKKTYKNRHFILTNSSK